MFILASKMFLLIHPPTGELDDGYWLDYEVKAYSSIIGIAFTRAENKPAAPTGGSYSNPHPVEGNWKAAPYNGDGNLWYSIRHFNENVDIQVNVSPFGRTIIVFDA